MNNKKNALFALNLARENADFAADMNSEAEDLVKQRDHLFEQIRDLQQERESLQGQMANLQTELWNRPANPDEGRASRDLEVLRAEQRQLAGCVDVINLKPFKVGTGIIPTIKWVRTITGLGLKESKDLVDGWVRYGLIARD